MSYEYSAEAASNGAGADDQHHHVGVPVAEEVEVADAAVSAVLPGYVRPSSVAVLDSDIDSDSDVTAGDLQFDNLGNTVGAWRSDLRSSIDSNSGSPATASESSERERKSCRDRDSRKLVGMVLVGVVVAVAVAVAVAVSAVQGDNNNVVQGTADQQQQQQQQQAEEGTTTMQEAPEQMGKETERLMSLRDLLDRELYHTDDSGNGTSPLLDRVTYQYSALRWLADVDKLDLPLPNAVVGSEGESPPTAAVALLERTQRIVQRYSLAALYYGTAGDGWRVQGNFLDASLDECQWNTPLSGTKVVGVGECNEQGWVTLLSLERNRLRNVVDGIPDELFQLRHLHTLLLPGNDLEGTLSPKVNQLSNLRILDLDDTNLRGGAPDMAGLGRLQIFGACCNELTAMPTFGRSVRSVDVSFNRIVGSVPQEYTTYGALHTLIVDGNFLVGSVDFLCNAFPTISIVVDRGEVSCYCCE
uniref:Uncharacterized protein n=1 Tax=Minutocellus polymorphus TaxID=265543 RepID=A0A7S0FN60_9STRA|mmetsp:Transcript_19152/g.31739  ORF Transcript_19152/g.31739 Transcript_19152/m.31739 type:complete len:472 (+) Transcript_19152:108-1523(+)